MNNAGGGLTLEEIKAETPQRPRSQEEGQLEVSVAAHPSKTAVSEMVRGLVSSRTAEQYLKRGERRVTAQAAAGVGRGRQPAKTVGKGRRAR